MGVRTKTVKRHSKQIVEKYYSRLTLDFHTNKRIIDEVGFIPLPLQRHSRLLEVQHTHSLCSSRLRQVAIVPSKRMRNKIAGWTTHLMCVPYLPPDAFRPALCCFFFW